MSKRVALSNEHSSLDDIQSYYVDSENALNAYFMDSHLTGSSSVRFFGYTTDKLNAELQHRKEYLDRMCSLEVLSAIEARFHIDYIVRTEKRKKDDLSKAFRKIFKERRQKVTLKDHLIKTWRIQYPQHKTRLDKFSKALDYRHWLAHGRYWQPNRSPHSANYDYLEIYTLASDIFAHMDLRESQHDSHSIQRKRAVACAALR
jgi:hypothetical protein